MRLHIQGDGKVTSHEVSNVKGEVVESVAFDTGYGPLEFEIPHKHTHEGQKVKLDIRIDFIDVDADPRPPEDRVQLKAEMTKGPPQVKLLDDSFEEPELASDGPPSPRGCAPGGYTG